MGARLELHLTDETDEGLRRLASRAGLSTNAVASDLLERFVIEELATIEGIERALDDLRQGRMVSHEQVKASVEARLHEVESGKR